MSRRAEFSEWKSVQVCLFQENFNEFQNNKLKLSVLAHEGFLVWIFRFE